MNFEIAAVSRDGKKHTNTRTLSRDIGEVDCDTNVGGRDPDLLTSRKKFYSRDLCGVINLL